MSNPDKLVKLDNGAIVPTHCYANPYAGTGQQNYIMSNSLVSPDPAFTVNVT